MLSSKITSVTYENGKRLETVINEYMLSDDTIKLGQLQTSLGQRLARKEQILAAYADATAEQQANLDRELAHIEAEINACNELIATQQGYIDGYTAG